LLRCRNKGTWS